MYNHQLDTFIQVADSGSFSKAANDSYITPTAVMKQINLLEKELGLRLFDRTHRGLKLTKAGESLYRDAKYIIQYSKDSVIRAKNAMNETDNVIRIGTSPMTPGQFLLDIWPKIHIHCPDIKFQLITFENTPENAREILKNLGQNIDIVAGVFDNAFLRSRSCEALELFAAPICCGVSIHHRLASLDKLKISDLYGEDLMLIQRGWNSYVDILRDDIWEHHPEINIVDFSFYNVSVFNQCENNNGIIMTIENWANVHPLLKIIPVDWNYTIPFGILHSPSPSKTVQNFLNAVQKAMNI